MTSKLSPRLLAIVEALPLAPGLRILEIGCGPGAMAREIAARIGDGHVLAIDRSARAIEQTRRGSGRELASGRMSVREVSAEAFELLNSEPPFDLAVSIRVGAFDGRHPKIEALAKQRIFAALKPGGRFFIDGGNPLIELKPGDEDT